jgi:hypothetical protein
VEFMFGESSQTALIIVKATRVDTPANGKYSRVCSGTHPQTLLLFFSKILLHPPGFARFAVISACPFRLIVLPIAVDSLLL